MASIARDSGGRKRLMVTIDDTRKTIHLGKMTVRDAETTKAHVEEIASARFLGRAVEDDTLRWISKLDTKMRDKLVKAGLVAAVERKGAVLLGAFIKGYLENRNDLKPRTVACMKQTQRNLVDFFGADRDMNTITAGQIEDFRQYLVKEGLAEATVNRGMSRVGQFFSKAFRDGNISKDPFDTAKLPSFRVRGNDDRFHFVTREEVQKLIDAAPDAQWRLLIALARFGGLRCPSEPLALTWADVNWEHKRIRISSCKTERYAGKGQRWIPLYPELRPFLQQVFDEAKPGAVHVIMRYRAKCTSLGDYIKRIAVRAGVDLWEKPWQNMRASRHCELIKEGLPSHVAAKWQGNSDKVANEHYLLDADSYYEKWTAQNGAASV